MAFLDDEQLAKRDDSPGHQGIHHLHKRGEELFDRLIKDKLLFLYGPVNSGKKTVALHLIFKWQQVCSNHLRVRWYEHPSPEELLIEPSLRKEVLTNDN